MYNNILGRDAGPSEIAFWAGAVRRGDNSIQVRSDVVIGFVTSDEYRLGLIDGWYLDYLDRQSEAEGRLFWLQQMKSGVPQEQIQTGFLSSPEYRNRI